MLVVLLLAPSSGTNAWELLIPVRSEWSYLDDGSDPGTAWREHEFRQTWPTGRADLGFGDGNRSRGTVIRDRGMTAYFRHRFELTAEQLLRIKGLRLRVRRDDGVIVWLNGREAYRFGLKPGPVTATDDGSRTYNDTYFFRWFTSAEQLREGSNVVAVEVHKANEQDDNLSFDLDLAGSTGEVEIWRGPYLQRGTPHGATIRFLTSVPVAPTLHFGRRALTRSRLGDKGTDHTFVLEDLEPDTRYFYSIEVEGQGLTSPPDDHWFRTHPRTGEDRPARIWVIGDAGEGMFSGVERVIDSYQFLRGETPTDVWLMLGDNAYRHGTLEEYQNALFAPFAPILRNTFSWPVIGNHDERSFDPDGGPYFDVFTLPTRGEAGGYPSGSELYYAFDYGNIHFVALYSNGNALAAGNPQLEWLERDLQANQSEWTIAFVHEAPYSTGEHDCDLDQQCVNLRQNALPILERHGVDLVLAGHSHYYQRTNPIHGHYGPAASWDPTTHLVDGDAEGTVYVIVGNSSLLERRAPLGHPAVGYGDARALGSLMIDIAGGRLEGRYLRIDKTVPDRFVIAHSPARSGSKIPGGWRLVSLLVALMLAAWGGFLLWRRPT